MFLMRCFIFIVIGMSGAGCTYSQGRVYTSQDWKSGQPLGKVLVFTPPFDVASKPARHERDEKIRLAIRAALETVPQTQVMESSPMPVQNGNAPVSEPEAIAAGAKAGAQTVCMVTVGQFGGRYLLTLLPPGWDSRTTVQYAVRLIDVKTGAVLVDSVRERTAGGYLAIMTSTYPDDLRADLSQVLSTKKQSDSGSVDE